MKAETNAIRTQARRDAANELKAFYEKGKDASLKLSDEDHHDALKQMKKWHVLVMKQHG